MKYYWVILCAAIVIAVVLSTNPPPPLLYKGGEYKGWIFPRGTVHKVKIGDGVFLLRIADTEKERERGLGGTQALAQNEGMLFIFPADALHAIWMKAMRIPIDILWLSATGEVIDAKENISSDTFPVIFTPKALARLVVELPAGSVGAFGISIGSRAKFFPQ